MNHNWVNNHGCSLLYNIHIATCSFVTILNRFELFSLRKQAYSNILKILPPKNENFQIKILICLKFLLKTKIVGTR